MDIGLNTNLFNFFIIFPDFQIKYIDYIVEQKQ